MSEQQGGNGEWAASESKDWKDDRHRRENEHVQPHAAEVRDSTARRTLTAMEGAYRRAYRRGWLSDEWPESIRKANIYEDLRDHFDTEAFSERVEQGDAAGLRAHVGSQSDGVDVSGWHNIEAIREIATERHLRLYIYGEPGSGKTRSGCLIARHWLTERASNARVLTNIRTLAEQQERVNWVAEWSALQETMDREMDDILSESVRPFLFLFDEASSQASGSGKDGYEAKQKLATLVYKIRKFGGALVIIGHDGKDVHPAVRELCKVLEKEDKKTAQFYETVRNREGREPITSRITGWPDSQWSPNDKDPAPWSWSTSDGTDMEEIEPRDWAIYHAVRARQAGVSNEIAAETVGYSTAWLSKKYEDGEPKPEIQQTVNRVAEVIE